MTIATSEMQEVQQTENSSPCATMQLVCMERCSQPDTAPLPGIYATLQLVCMESACGGFPLHGFRRVLTSGAHETSVLAHRFHGIELERGQYTMGTSSYPDKLGSDGKGGRGYLRGYSFWL